MYVVGQIFFLLFSCLACFASPQKMFLAIPPHPLQSQKRENTLGTFLANAAKERGREMKMGAGIIFSQISPFFSRFVTLFSRKREEEETKEHLVRKSGKASVVEEEKKEKCAYG